MQFTPLLDSAGRRRSPAITASFHEGRAPRNKGLRYPPDPPAVEEKAGSDRPQPACCPASKMRPSSRSHNTHAASAVSWCADAA